MKMKLQLIIQGNIMSINPTMSINTIMIPRLAIIIDQIFIFNRSNPLKIIIRITMIKNNHPFDGSSIIKILAFTIKPQLIFISGYFI